VENSKNSPHSELELPLLPEELSVKKEEKKTFLGSFFGKKKEEPKPAPRIDEFAPPEFNPEEKAPEKKGFSCAICGQEFRDSKALKSHTKQIHPGGIKYCLVLNTGDKIKDFDDLVHYIKYMNENTFLYHTSATNEFADWVESALGNAELAKKMRTAKTRVDTIRVLYGKEARTEDELKKSESEADAHKARQEEMDLEPVEDYEKLIPNPEEKKKEESRKGFLGLFRKKEEKKQPEKTELLLSEPTDLEKQLQESISIIGPAQENRNFPKEKAELDGLKNELDEKSSQLSHSVGELLKNKIYIREKNKELAKTLNEIEAGQKKIEKSRKMLEDKLSNLEKIQEGIKDRERRLSDRKKELENQEKIIALKKKQIEDYRIKANDLRELRKELPKLKSEYSETARKLEKADAKLRKTEEQYEKKGPGLERVRSEIREREMSITQKEAELESKKAQLMDIQYRLLEEKNKLEEERFDLYVKHELKKEPSKGFSPAPAPEQKVPMFIKQAERQAAPDSDFESSINNAAELAEEGRIPEAKFIAEKLEKENAASQIPEQIKRERAYRIMELKTDIRLASMKYSA
jgi:hypothetical protein